MKKAKVLLTPSSSGMAIAAIKSLRKDKRIKIISTDIDRLAPGLYLSDCGYMVPPFSEEAYYDALKKIVKKEKIDVIIPCLDTILIEFSKRRNEFEDMGTKILVSDQKTLEISRDKWKTYNKLRNIVPVPISYIDQRYVDLPFPLFIKPRYGSGSKDAYKVNSQEDLDFYWHSIKDPIIQEYLIGKEFTVDCLADAEGNLIIDIPRERIEVKAGISIKSRIVEDERLSQMARKIAEKIKFYGPFFFQAKEDEHQVPKLTEINARISGTMSLSSFSGSNIHLLAIKLCLGDKIEKPHIKTGLFLTRCWEEIYLTEDEIT